MSHDHWHGGRAPQTTLLTRDDSSRGEATLVLPLTPATIINASSASLELKGFLDWCRTKTVASWSRSASVAAATKLRPQPIGWSEFAPRRCA
jgi:hypothetical protein